MADNTRLAAAGIFLALALAAIPALLPSNLAGAAPGRLPTGVQSPPPAIVHLRIGELPEPPDFDRTPEGVAPQGVLPLAMSRTAPHSHTVTPGETLWRISHQAGVGVEALAAANHLTLGATLHPGQVLSIPPLDPAFDVRPMESHEVAAGETLWGIARAVGVPLDALALANHLTFDAILHPGQTLVLPAGRAAAASGVRRRPLGIVGPPSLAPEPLLTNDSSALAAPSNGKITSRFGWRIHPIFGTREFHTGVDIANHIGTPVRAAQGGMVRFVGWMAGYGRLIVVAHGGGLETSYSHLSTMLVTLGQRVATGQVLGGMGNTGWSTGPHLLFEVRRNGVPIDPIPWLQGVRRAAVTVTSAMIAHSTAGASLPMLVPGQAVEHRAVSGSADQNTDP